MKRAILAPLALLACAAFPAQAQQQYKPPGNAKVTIYCTTTTPGDTPCTASGGGGGGGDASAANQTAVQAVAGSDASKAEAVQGITGGKPIPVTSGVAQGSTTSGQTLSPIGCRTLTSAPTDTTAQTNIPRCTTAGSLAVDGSGVTQPVSGSVANNDGTNTQKVLAASTSPALADKAAIVAISPNPAPVCTGVIPISQTTSTDVKTFTNTGFICAIVLVTDTAQFVAVTEGTGTVCATGAAALLGSTTVGSGLSFAANGGVSIPAGVPWLKMQTAADHLCILQSGSGRLSGVITYQDHS